MLSGKLIRLIESHEEPFTAGIVSAIRHHRELPHLGKLPDIELRERCQEIVRNLGHWLAHGNDQKLAGEYDSIGRLRYEESVPLEECLRGLFLIKYRIIDFLDEQGIEADPLALYAEGEFVRRIGPFFDLLAVHLVRGYEMAQGRAAHAVI